MRCAKHGTEHDCRLKANAHGHGGEPGAWFCDACHPPAAALVQHGMIEWHDGRETLPMERLPRNTREDILRSIGPVKGKVSELARAQEAPEPEVDEVEAVFGHVVTPGSAPSEAKGPACQEQAAPGPAGLEPKQSTEPVRAAAPTPTPPPPKKFVDAAMLDLDAAVAEQTQKPKPKRKKVAPKAKPAPGPSLF